MNSPTRLGKYEIRRELGKGSMGVVYEAFDPFIERRVAIKIIRQDQFGAGQTADLLARLRREAQAAGRLNHPGIVGIYDYGEDSTLGGSGVAYIAMELIDGSELKDLFDADHRFSQADIVRIMGEVLAALQHAHDHGVTHRDIKPSNVILLRNGRVKVADFGVARLDTSEMTQAGTLIGTPMYMSPEQILGQPVDGRSDLFACGVMLYQFLTGEKPFTGSITTVMQKVLHMDPVPVTQLNAALSPAWDTVLRKALAKKPADRYQSADEMAAAIRHAAIAPQVEAPHDEATIILPRPSPAATVPLTPIPPVVPKGAPSVVPSAARTLGPSAEAALSAAFATAGATRRDKPPVPTPPVPARRGVKPAAVMAAGAVVVGGIAVAALWWSGSPQPKPGERVAKVETPPQPPAQFPTALPQPGSAAVSTTPAASAAAAAPFAASTPSFSPAPPASRPTPPAIAPVQTQATAPSPAPAPAPAPAPKPPAPVKVDPPKPAATIPTKPAPPPAVAAAPAPPVPDPATEWKRRVSRLGAARGATTLSAALGQLLDPLSADERALATEFESQFKLRPAYSALVIGAVDGYFRLSWQTRAPSAERALDLALKRCREVPAAVSCSPVLVNGEFRRDGLIAVARELGNQPPDVVRTRVLRVFERTIAEWRQLDTAALARAQSPAPAAPPYEQAPTQAAAPPAQATPAPKVVAAPTPAELARAEWAQSLAQLRANESRLTFASGLEILLRATNAEDSDRLSRMESAMKRMRWNSAVAFGEKNGYLVFGYFNNERRPDWAQERALAECAKYSAAPCTLVMTDGSFRAIGLIEAAGRLGSRPQPVVREAFMRGVQRVLQSGG